MIDRAADQIVVLLARKMQGFGKVQVGVNTPLAEAAAHLARTLGHPGPVVFIAPVSGLHRRPRRVSLVAEEWAGFSTSPAFPLETVIDLMEGAEGVDDEPIHPMQIDAQGNLNLSGIRTSNGTLSVLGPGPAGLDLLPHLNSGGSTIYLTRHDPRRIVERVSMITGPAPRNGQSTMDGAVVDVVTNLGRLTIGAGGVRLISRHSWVEPEEIVAATGCRIEVPADCTLSLPPSDEELAALADIDPHRMRTLEFRSAPERRKRCSQLWRMERAEMGAGSLL